MSKWVFAVLGAAFVACSAPVVAQPDPNGKIAEIRAATGALMQRLDRLERAGGAGSAPGDGGAVRAG